MWEDFDADSLSNDRDTALQWYLHNVAGTYHSNWWFLVSAAASNFLLAVREFQGTIEAWKNACEQKQDQAETSFVLELNYQCFITGPLIAAVLMPSFALESFLRLCAEVALRLHTENNHTLLLAINGYDGKSFEDRVHDAISLSGACELSPDLKKSVKALIEFRNSLVHDVPFSHLEIGKLGYVKRGRQRTVQDDRVYEGMYPLMYGKTMPLNLRHSKTALITHDEIVGHIFGQADKRFIKSLKKLAPTQLIGKCIQDHMPTHIWKDTDHLIDFWESTVLTWCKSIPVKVRKNFLRDFSRKSKIRLVD